MLSDEDMKQNTDIGLSDEDHATRANGIGSSEIAMLVYVKDEATGEMKPLSPWGGRHKLWVDKVYPKDFIKKKTTGSMTVGNYLENGITQWCADKMGYDWEKPKTIRHDKYFYVVDSCDGLAYAKDRKDGDLPLRCIESKTAFFQDKNSWGEEGTDQIPLYYLVQCMWHMGCWETQDKVCDVPVLLNGTFKHYQVAFDEELYLSLVMKAEKFWLDYVQPKKEPKCDSDTEKVDWLSKKLAKMKTNGQYIVVDTDSKLFQLLQKLRQAKSKYMMASNQLDGIKAEIIGAIGENDGLDFGDCGKISFKNIKGRKTTAWKAVVDDLMGQVEGREQLSNRIRETVERHTTTGEEARRWSDKTN